MLAQSRTAQAAKYVYCFVAIPCRIIICTPDRTGRHPDLAAFGHAKGVVIVHSSTVVPANQAGPDSPTILKSLLDYESTQMIPNRVPRPCRMPKLNIDNSMSEEVRIREDLLLVPGSHLQFRIPDFPAFIEQKRKSIRRAGSLAQMRRCIWVWKIVAPSTSKTSIDAIPQAVGRILVLNFNFDDRKAA